MYPTTNHNTKQPYTAFQPDSTKQIPKCNLPLVGDNEEPTAYGAPFTWSSGLCQSRQCKPILSHTHFVRAGAVTQIDKTALTYPIRWPPDNASCLKGVDTTLSCVKLEKKTKFVFWRITASLKEFMASQRPFRAGFLLQKKKSLRRVMFFSLFIWYRDYDLFVRLSIPVLLLTWKCERLRAQSSMREV